MWGLLAARPAAAQSATPALDSPAAYRQAGLHGPEHARLVRELLRYELRNMKRLVTNHLLLRPNGYSYTITNRATLAEVTSGSYVVSYYNAQGQVLETTTGRFGGMAPGASRNQSVSFPRPPEATRAELSITDIQAE
ncbi:MAG: hypothetical protein NVS3B25_11380 [Hymenobacter sp.]